MAAGQMMADPLSLQQLENWLPPPDPPGKIAHFRAHVHRSIPATDGRATRTERPPDFPGVVPPPRAARGSTSARQGKAPSRRRKASSVPWKMTLKRWAVVEDRLRDGWSPEPIAGRLPQSGAVMAGREWIDPSIRADRPAGRGHIPGRVGIAERPAIGEAKCRIGDGELDGIIGARHRGAGISGVDRALRFRGLIRVAGKTAVVVTEVIVQRMGRDRVHTGTADHGKEFAGHREIAKALGANWDFATPDHAWERGLNEQANGLVRQSFPKGTDCRLVTPARVRAVAERFHHRPRKVLGVRTPEEVFTRVALQAVISALGRAEFFRSPPAPGIRGMPSCQERAKCCTSVWKGGINSDSSHACENAS